MENINNSIKSLERATYFI